MPYNDRFNDEPDRKINKINSVSPLFIYKVLKYRTNDKHHITQAELQRILADEPYNITLSRKAIARHISTLEMMETGVRVSTYNGVWYSKIDDRLFGNAA